MIPEFRIPLIGRIKIIREDEEYSIDEYYGGFSNIFHVFICMKVFEFCENRIQDIFIPVDYDLLKERHYNDDPDFFMNNN